MSAIAGPSDKAVNRLKATILDLEVTLSARIGVSVFDSGSDWRWGHRENDRFLMASTFKSVLCGAVLDRVDRGVLALDQEVMIHPKDILDYAPVTKRHASKTLSLGVLCHATLDQSDNTAANLLINRLGGPDQVTAFARAIGDSVTRLDRMEPELNNFAPGDPRDTTSPAAIVATWHKMLLGRALSAGSRAQLADWMRAGGVTQALIRASTPKTWDVVDKSGGGRRYTRNIIAMITPPDSAPVFVAIFVSDTPADWETRNAALRKIGAAVVEVIKSGL